MNINVFNDFTQNPLKYLSYNQVVRYAIQDVRPRESHLINGQEARISFPHMNPKYSIIFKIDGAKVHPGISSIFFHISADFLEKYGKSPEEFYFDWRSKHYKHGRKA